MSEPESQTVLFAGGGTGGHLYPGIAVAQALRSTAPGVRCVFLCTTREIDRVILEATGFKFIPQPIERPAYSIGGLLKFWWSWRQTKDLVKQVLKEQGPSAVLGLGGYAAGVAVKVAGKRGIPAAVLNPDVVPGKANVYLMGYARAICCQFESTRQRVPAAHRNKVHMTGCPIRPDILTLPPRQAANEALGLDPALHTLMVTGASQGAQTVNEAVIETLSRIKLQGWQVLHLAGRQHGDAVREAYRRINLPARVIDFTPAMRDVWAASDLCVSRSGASTCAELAACGIPSILMPYPFHKDQHQRLNARELADAGAAVLVDDLRDARRNAEKLEPELTSLLYDAPRRETMASAARAMGKPDAAARVAKVLVELAGGQTATAPG